MDTKTTVPVHKTGSISSGYLGAKSVCYANMVHHSLAYAEIYLSLAHIMRRFEFAPFETTLDNICVYRELGVGYPKRGSFDVRARVVGVIEK